MAGKRLSERHCWVFGGGELELEVLLGWFGRGAGRGGVGVGDDGRGLDMVPNRGHLISQRDHQRMVSIRIRLKVDLTGLCATRAWEMAGELYAQRLPSGETVTEGEADKALATGEAVTSTTTALPEDTTQVRGALDEDTPASDVWCRATPWCERGYGRDAEDVEVAAEATEGERLTYGPQDAGGGFGCCGGVRVVADVGVFAFSICPWSGLSSKPITYTPSPSPVRFWVNGYARKPTGYQITAEDLRVGRWSSGGAWRVRAICEGRLSETLDTGATRPVGPIGSFLETHDLNNAALHVRGLDRP
ncbi:hypothetical protein BKA70DRAFT_1226637 [Coprinopsis sp. MPI-PUGE-AT-0042]|nr:hypothetical protein BKA70DRAFT_1226637 [Coprinopsis sp. MPI-PUGE-AT-0042]